MREVAPRAREIVVRFRHDNADILDVEVHHIGATAMPFGHTRGDVDVNVRVKEAAFGPLITALRKRFQIAQAESWSPTFASFSTERYPLPLGIQVTVLGSKDDYLLALCERMHAQPEVLREYDDHKLRAAARGATAYWNAKNQFLQALVADYLGSLG